MKFLLTNSKLDYSGEASTVIRVGIVQSSHVLVRTVQHYLANIGMQSVLGP